MQGWPLQYLLGYTWFYGRKFDIEHGVLIPRPETEILIETALKLIPKKARWNIFDIGCGSGAVGITLACERAGCEVHCSDISPKAVRLTDKNAKHHTCAHKIVLARGKNIKPWDDELNEKRRGVIVANLPYLSQSIYNAAPTEVKNYEPKKALLGGGEDGTRSYKKLFKEIAEARSPHLSALIIEIEPEQKKILTRTFKKYFPEWKVTFKKDLHGDYRVALFTKRHATA